MPNFASFAKWYVSGISHSRNCKMRNFESAVEATTLHLICSFDFPFLRVVPCLRLNKRLLNTAFNSFWFLVRFIEFWNLKSLNLQLLHSADSFDHHHSHFFSSSIESQSERKVEIKLSLIIFFFWINYRQYLNRFLQMAFIKQASKLVCRQIKYWNCYRRNSAAAFKMAVKKFSRQ